jgi:ligand-binding sensor domain-containing protein
MAGRTRTTCSGAVPLLALLLALGAGPASAEWQSFRGARDGLADNQVLSILEDRDGALWFGTPKGASRFDGVRWTTERDSLPNLTVLSLAQDRSGAYWFGTENGGVMRLEGTRRTRFSSPGVLPGNQVEAILEDHRGDLWFGTPAGLARYQPGPGTWTTFTAAAGGLVHSHAWRLAEDHDFNLWIATPKGVSCLDSTRTLWRSYTASPGALARDSVLSLAVDRAGAVWCGTDQGAFRYLSGTWTRYVRADGLGCDSVVVISPDASGAVWFGGRTGGISRYDGRAWRQYRETPDGDPGWILSMQQDRSGNLWVGTASSGLYRFDGMGWHNHFSTSTTCPAGSTQSAPYSYVLDGNCIQSMLLDHRADLWFATYDGGASRYDHAGKWSTFRRGAGMPIADSLNVLFEDRAGDLWFGSSGGGVARFDSARSVRVAFTRQEGLASDTVQSIFQDRRGDLWFGTKTGASRYDGVSWNNALTGPGSGSGIEVKGIVEDSVDRLWFRTSDGLYQLDAARTGWRRFGTADGLADNVVNAMVVDAAGRVVVGTPKGLSWFDGSAWTTLTRFGAPRDSVVWSLLVDHSGHLWAGLGMGAATYDGSTWTHYSYLTLPVGPPVYGIFEDDLHTIWLRTTSGLARFNGDTWRAYDSRGDGLAVDMVTGFLQDAVGHLWFASDGGLTEFQPDRVAPQTVLLSGPALLTVSRDVDLVFGAGYGESSDIEFSLSFDGRVDSLWSSTATWSRRDLPDGPQEFTVRARDWSRNVDPTPARIAWEVDATPPNAILSSPLFGQPVRGVLEVRGSATDPRFRSYRVDARPVGATHWSIPIDSSTVAAGDTLLASWDTRTAGEGDYDLRLAVLDTLGLLGLAQVTVIVDNAAPWADVTTPARVSALNGGDVYTTNQEIHLYFPPRAFPDDAVVSVTPADPPPTMALPPAAVAVTAGYGIAWSVGPLAKTATLEFALPDSLLLPADATPAIYLGHGDEGWTRLGGTFDASRRVIGAPIVGPGRYAIVLDAGAGSGTGGIDALELTPRVFSPSGGFASTSAAISFTLARPASTTVTVFNRAGRRVRSVMSGRPLGTGANLVYWDGRDDAGGVVEDGIYLVGVEALGEVRKRTVAVVR